MRINLTGKAEPRKRKWEYRKCTQEEGEEYNKVLMNTKDGVHNYQSMRTWIE
ncbi:MAG: hypothetical protein ACKPKO_53370 [Candidatus Fonsibacter sp.]